MPTEVVLLGTAGGPTPKTHRSAPSQAVVVDGRVFVIDCGSGVAGQLRRAGLPYDDIEAVFVTHHHCDHNADLGNLLLLGWAAGMTSSLEVVGPPPLRRHLGLFWAMQEFDVQTRIADEGRPDPRGLAAVREFDVPGVVYAREGVVVRAARVAHPPIEHAYAFRFDTPDRSVVVSGDTAPCAALIELAHGADVLIHEVMHVPSLEATLARSNGDRLRQHLLDSHTTSTAVGEVAQRAGVGRLVLSHLVPGNDEVPDDVWIADARRAYDGPVVVGGDLMRL